MKQFAPYAGWIGLAFGIAALLFYMVIPQLALVNYSFALIALINITFFLWAEWHQVKKALRSRTTLYGMNSAVMIGVFFGILVFVNLLAFRHKIQFDLTETGFYTLAPQTENVVSDLAREVKITAFYQTDSPSRAEFKRLLDGYLKRTEKILLEFVDPDTRPSITKRYGVTTYGTIVLESGGRETKIKQGTEENLTNALLQVTQDKQKKVYFLDGHAEKNIKSEEKNGYAKIREALEKDNYQVDTLLLLKAAAVPEDADLVILAGPEKILQNPELQALETYLQRGGSLMVLIDPQIQAGLKTFLERWGVDIQDDLIVDPMSKMFGGDYAAPVISQYSPHGITKNFTLPTIFPLLRSVKEIHTEGLEVTEVLFSGKESWAETDYKTSKVRYNPDVDLKGPVPVAVAVSKNLGSPESTSSKGGDPASPSKRKANLVVIGDSDFATNNYYSFSGNSDFFLNAASWLLQEENLISIRPRKRKLSPLPMTQGQGNVTFAVGFILLPAITILAGVSIWWRRRSL